MNKSDFIMSGFSDEEVEELAATSLEFLQAGIFPPSPALLRSVYEGLSVWVTTEKANKMLKDIQMTIIGEIEALKSAALSGKTVEDKL